MRIIHSIFGFNSPKYNGEKIPMSILEILKLQFPKNSCVPQTQLNLCHSGEGTTVLTSQMHPITLVAVDRARNFNSSMCMNQDDPHGEQRFSLQV